MDTIPSFDKIKKRDGTLVEYDEKKLPKAILNAARAVGRRKKELANELSEKVIQELNKNFNKKDNPGVEDFQDAIEKVLIEEGHAKIAKAFILYRSSKTKLREEKASLIGSKEKNKLSINAIRLLKARYLLKDSNGRIIETPNEMFRRVAKNIASADKNYKSGNHKKSEEEFYKIMFNLDFLPNSPTIMNAGTKIQQLVSCYVLPVDDSLDSIFKTLNLAMNIQKTGAGTGFSFSNLRQKKSKISKNGCSSSGPVPFIKVFDEATGAIKKGGTRRGANMGILRVDHPDILTFIRLKESESSMTNFNISIGITNEFMESVQKHEDWELKDPRTNETVSTLDARFIWDSLIASAWTNGEPGIIFLDRINKDNKSRQEDIIATSPCAEVPMLSNESCMIGSINVGNFVIESEDKKVDWKLLRETIHTAIHFLDNTIDQNNYPSRDIKEKSLAYRKIGLGIMGFAGMLAKLRIPYDSEKGVEMGKKLAKFFRKEADNASHELAKKRGVYTQWKLAKNAAKRKMRNATRLSIAPTGSISMIADCSAGIEPLFAISYVKRVMGGKQFFYIDGNLKDALKENKIYKEEIIDSIVNRTSIRKIRDIPLKLRKVFTVAHDIAPEWHINMQAAFQESVDNAISKTVNFPNRTTMKDIEKVYLHAWKSNCKGITIYRDGSRSNQVLQSNSM
ncbi:adenosylcobalamin-dependent ribonucleoside-diphosphate reductase [Candidatus Woesearchaeota archaeon]|nr:adenosylcobalamin-dependent ribonucleoside-diphosphate reductase [Candidatus Woesearchaeota archaeon]